MEVSESYYKLLKYAFVLVGKKRYTIVGMFNKLASYSKKRVQIDFDDIEKVVQRLMDLKYLNDGLYVKDYVAERIRLRPRGKALMTKELRTKGISKEVLDICFEHIEIDERSIAYDLLLKRIRRWEKFPLQRQKMKAYQFLYSRGFNGDAIYKAVERCYDRGE